MNKLNMIFLSTLAALTTVACHTPASTTVVTSTTAQNSTQQAVALNNPPPSGVVPAASKIDHSSGHVVYGSKQETIVKPEPAVQEANADAIPHANLSLDQLNKIKMDEALNNNIPSQASHWTAGDGTNYSLTPLKNVSVKGNIYCREYQLTKETSGKTEQSNGTSCLQHNGSWKNVG